MQIFRNLEITNIYSKDGYSEVSRAWNMSAWNRMEFDKATWMGLTTKQLLPDIYLIQEVVSKARPEIILETGTGRGGTTLLLASLLFFLEGKKLITIDLKVSDETRRGISRFPSLASMINFVEGSSIEQDTVARAKSLVDVGSHVLLIFDAGHTRHHVLQELRMYSDLLQEGDYIIVCDTNMSYLSTTPRGVPQWTTNSPSNAIEEFLRENDNFEIDRSHEHWEITSFPDGILRHK